MRTQSPGHGRWHLIMGIDHHNPCVLAVHLRHRYGATQAMVVPARYGHGGAHPRATDWAPVHRDWQQHRRLRQVVRDLRAGYSHVWAA